MGRFDPRGTVLTHQVLGGFAASIAEKTGPQLGGSDGIGFVHNLDRFLVITA
jgi:hypothetical protein